MTEFRDIRGHWAEGCIEKLVGLGLVKGYPDGTFQPDHFVTRAEFAAFAVRAFPNQPVIRQAIVFKDLSATHWAYGAVSQAYRQGFLSGYADRTFRPAENILRVHGLISLASGLKLPLTQPTDYTLNQTFRDGSEVPVYGRNVTAAATERGLVVNYPDVGLLRPNVPATRAEIAAFIIQALLDPGELSPIDIRYQARAVEAPVPAGEIRGVWLTNIDSNVLYYPEILTQAIELLAELNINTLYPVVWNRGYTLYPSAVMQQLVGESVFPVSLLQNRNMLDEIIPQAHAKNMSVLPWFEFGFMLPRASSLIQSHRHWISERQDGSFLVPESSNSSNLLAWLNPFHPEVQQFIQDLILEVVRNYDIEGIQVDDHFGLPVELGYDPFTVQLYQQEHQGKLPSSNYRDAEWVAWRASKLTNFVRQLFIAIKTTKPNCILGLSPNTQTFSYNNYLQDWYTWERQGYLEEIVMQVYRNNLESFSPDLQQPEVLDAKIHVPFGVGILTGLRNRPSQISMVEAQVQATRDRRFAGVAFFFYESLRLLTTTPTGKAELQALFSTPIARPTMSGTKSDDSGQLLQRFG